MLSASNYYLHTIVTLTVVNFPKKPSRVGNKNKSREAWKRKNTNAETGTWNTKGTKQKSHVRHKNKWSTKAHRARGTWGREHVGQEASEVREQVGHKARETPVHLAHEARKAKKHVKHEAREEQEHITHEGCKARKHVRHRKT